MKKKMICGFLVLSLAVLSGVSGAHAEAEFVEIQAQAEEIDSDPSSFEGDSGSMPGERAPESMPMDDAPVDGGIGVGI